MNSTCEDSRSTVPSLAPFLLLCGLTAAWIDLAGIHRQHQADSLIPILTSLYQWTPYFWETNRYGMLVPLLAIPIKHPLFNLLVQDGLTIFSGLAVLGFLPRYVLRDSTWPAVAIFSVAAFLALAPERYRFAYLVDQSYAVSFALGLGGLILCEQRSPARMSFRKLSLALLLMSLAHWVNIGVGLLLVPLLMLRCLLVESDNRDSDVRAAGASPNEQPPQTRLMRTLRTDLNAEATNALVVIVAAFALGFLGMQLAHYRETPEGFRPPATWALGWSQLIANTWTALTPHYWPLVALVLAQLGILGQLSGRGLPERRLAPFRAAMIFLAAATVYLGFLGTLTWVEHGGFSDRYTIPAVLLLHAAASALVIAPVVSELGRRGRQWAWTLAPLVVLTAFSSYGYPSLQGVRDDLEKRLGSRTVDLLAGHCTHLAGNYWEVWPAVFHANLVRYERGESAILWGVAFRSDPTRKFLQHVPREEMRVAIPHQDNHAPALLRQYHFPLLDLVEKRPTLSILRPRPQDETAQNGPNIR